MASIVLGSISNLRSAIIEEAPQSIRYRLCDASSKKQALYRPPLPKASPDPKNLTCMAATLARSLARSASLVVLMIWWNASMSTQMCEDESPRKACLVSYLQAEWICPYRRSG